MKGAEAADVAEAAVAVVAGINAIPNPARPILVLTPIRITLATHAEGIHKAPRAACRPA
jgi:hypothetical protein